ncbi:MAG: hypothetical protein KGZ58_13345, partial [Ignavibacteriales bacterium]|nr:hypothetical protein [Ignavibacteriales bacterium]
ILATLSGILFVFTGNFELGLFRDWDIASVYLFPLTFFCVFIFKQDFFHTEKNGTFSRLLFSLAGISLLHCGTWIALNNNEAKSMERFLTIQNDTEMSPTVRGYYQDQVGQFYLRKNDYQTAAHHFEIARRDISQHISLASRLKQCYLHTGEKEKLGVLLLRVVELDTMIPNNWLSLGQFYYDNENYAEAQRIFLKTLTLDSLNEQALFNLARLNFLQLNNSDEAIFSLKKILSVNSSHLDAMRAIIPPLLAKELFEEAEQYALQYLEYEPNDTLMTALLPDIQRARQEQSTSTNRNEIPRR